MTWNTGVTLAILMPAALLVHASGRSSAAQPGGGGRMFSNPDGVHRTVTTTGTLDADNPFFQDLGTNGRSCVTCHRPAQGWSITPPELQDRFDATGGLDPVFRTNDGSNCPGADVSTLEGRRQAFSLLLSRGVIRVALDVPADAEFELVDVDDPYDCNASPGSVAMYRRPLPTTNLGFLSAVMWDGRQTARGLSIRDNLVAQARDAVVEHAEGQPPAAAQLREIVNFELGMFTAQERSHAAGSLATAGVSGGPRTLERQPFCIGINDPLGMLPAVPGACLARTTAFDPVVFTLFNQWTNSPSPERAAIARGEAIFNTRQFTISNVPGLNGAAQDPVPTAITTGTCTVCHDTPNAGNHSVSMALNIGIAAPGRRTADLPLYTLRHRVTGELVTTTDPGRAMVTGRWSDIGKFKGPVLRSLSSRAPFFHDGSAASLAEVVDFYDSRFAIRLTAQEKADLIAFLRAL
jgi:hypothetical protein